MYFKAAATLCIASWALIVPSFVQAAGERVYLEPDSFIDDCFDGEKPEQQVLWVDKALRAAVEKLLGRNYARLRVRYHANEMRSVWVLDEIGKDLPITTGVVIENGAITNVTVLIFRESRGWEVRYPFFTDQFVGARANADGQLNTRIDGISGATMSVNALRKQARLALLFDAYIRKSNQDAG